MVVMVWWMESWTVVIISLCVLSLIGILLLCCVCWDTRKPGFHHFYVLDEKGNKRYLSSIDKNVNGCSTEKGVFYPVADESLTKSFQTLNKDDVECGRKSSIFSFNSAVLRIEENSDKDDEVVSCVSNDSKHTFYSTYPMVRTMSATDTMRSALSYTDVRNAK
ncbi:hypothetical protein FQR65_LT05939 [Abscondita terminalis]|nr:hypothetical protein FQR65_LT05939 [Abscondita terminalis]